MSLCKMFTILIILLISGSFLFSQEDVLRPNKPKKAEPLETDQMYYNPLSFGVEAGINYNMFSQDITWTPEVPNSVLNVFESASGIAPYIAFLVDYKLDYKMGFQLKLSYEGRAFSNTYTGLYDCVDVFDGSVSDAEQKNEFEITGADIGFSFLFRYNLINNLVLTGGPMFLVPAGNYKQVWTQTFLSEDCFFNFGTEQQSNQNEIRNEVELNEHFGLDFGLAYQIPISDMMVLSPQIRFNYMFSKVRDDVPAIDGSRSEFGTAIVQYENAYLHALKFGIALWF